MGGVEHGTQTRGRQHLHPRPARQQQLHLYDDSGGHRKLVGERRRIGRVHHAAHDACKGERSFHDR